MRCVYAYPDGAQCMAKTPDGKNQCTSHTLLMQRAKDKKKNNAKRYEQTKHTRASRAKPKVEKVMKVIPKKPYGVSFADHTAPWRCSLLACEKCKDKPTYNAWAEEQRKKKEG